MKKLILFFAAVCSAAMMQAQTIVENVKYIDANGEEKTCPSATVVTNANEAVTWGAPNETTWYVGNYHENIISGGIVCQGDVHLILADGYKLEVGALGNHAGIQVSGEGNSLTIYGQTSQSGQLIVSGGQNGAGIGGGFMGSGSYITINGGMVTATGGTNGAGIGGGANASGSNITINGGMVTATGGTSAASIGGGSNGLGSDITINGGKVTATSLENGAGIGGGTYGSGSNITINGGTVTATGQQRGAGIGGGYMGYGSYITINGGMVTATGEERSAAGIGSGYFFDGKSNNISVAAGLKVIADGSEITPSEDMASTLADKYSVTILDFSQACAIIDNAVGESQDEDILNVANTAKTSILEQTSVDGINAIIDFALTKINAVNKTIVDAVGGSTDATILDVANSAKTNILKQTTVDGINAISDLAVAKINAIKSILTWIGDDANVRNTEFISEMMNRIASETEKEVINETKTQAKDEIPIFKNGFSSGKEVGKTDAIGTLGTPQNGPVIEVIDQNDKVLKLYNPKKVKFTKENANE